MSWIDLNEEDLKEEEKKEEEFIERASRYINEAGIYDIKITAAYISENGDNRFFTLIGETQNEKELSVSTFFDKGPKNNKWSKDGKSGLYPGITQTAKLFKICGVDMVKAKPSSIKFEIYKDNIEDVLMFKELIGKKIKVAVNEREYLNNSGEIKTSLQVLEYMNLDGKDSRGNDALDRIKKKIEKEPIKKIAQSNESSSGGSKDDDSEQEDW